MNGFISPIGPTRPIRFYRTNNPRQRVTYLITRDFIQNTAAMLVCQSVYSSLDWLPNRQTLPQITTRGLFLCPLFGDFFLHVNRLGIHRLGDFL